MVKVFKVWRNKEALKMECNKRNRNIRYAICRYSNLKKLSEYLVLQSNIFQYFCDRFSKLKRFFSVFGPIIFYIFGRFVTKFLARNVPFLRMALGGPASSNTAEIYMQTHEHTAVSTALHPRKVWKPFVVDLYSILIRTHLKNFHHNNPHKNIWRIGVSWHFIMEITE